MIAGRARRRLRAATLLAILAFAAVFGDAAIAEDDDPLTPPDVERFRRWGPLRVRPGIRLRDLGYDDNVFNAVERTSDLRATIAPRIEGLAFLGDTAFLTFEEELRYTAYRERSELNYFDQVGRARVTVPFRGFGVWGEVRYDRIRESPIDSDDVRPVRERRGLAIGGVVDLGWRSRVEWTRERADRRNFDDDFNRTDLSIAEQLDRVETRDRIRLTYRAFGRTRFSLDARRLAVEFDTPNIDGLPGFERDADRVAFLPGVALAEGEALSGAVRVGWAELDHDGPAIAGFSGWIGEADVRWRPARTTTVRLSGDRDVGFSVSEGNAFFVDTRGEIEAVHFLNRRIGLDATVSLREIDIPGAARVDDIARQRIGVRVRLFGSDIGRRVEYILRIGRFERDSTVDALDRTRTTVGLDAQFGF